MKLSIVIPVYNEEQTVNEVIASVLAVDLGPIAREVIVVNDGSTDATARVANQFLTALTNALFGSRLTDMETAYKVMRREVLQRLRLQCDGFDIEPEVTAKLLLAGCRIVEVPISYRPRRADEGKKMRWTDGVAAISTLVRCRISGRRDVEGSH